MPLVPVLDLLSHTLDSMAVANSSLKTLSHVILTTNTSSAHALCPGFPVAAARDTEDHSVHMPLQPRSSGALANSGGTLNQWGSGING